MNDEWQPIETAPRDGTWILGMNNRGNCAVIIWHERALDRDGLYSGWIHPFTNGELSPFWNGAVGSVAIAWKALPHGDEARGIVGQFSSGSLDEIRRGIRTG